MTEMLVIDIGRSALFLLLKMAGPMLVTALFLGLMVSIFQAATNINEQTMTFIPKVIAVGGVLLYMMPTMGHQFTDFFNELMDLIPQIIP